jgi:hypothetical protein
MKLGVHDQNQANNRVVCETDVMQSRHISVGSREQTHTSEIQTNFNMIHPVVFFCVETEKYAGKQNTSTYLHQLATCFS